jgi:Tol biopolymer transport system component
MEYIDGRPLKGPMPIAEALRLAVQITDTLDAAHRKGIVHRDLKPGNILVTKSGVKLLDFGLAKMEPETTTLPEQAETLTQEGVITGTLQYMAPEQLEGQKADARSDIFAFGAVLYEMVTGQRAFEGSSPASVIAAIVGGQSGSLEQLPSGLDHVVKGCLAKDREDRWQSVADIKRELEWLAEGGATAVVAPAPLPNVWRERIAWILAASVLVALLLAALWRTPSTGEVTRFGVYPPQNTTFSYSPGTSVAAPQFALSPDGRMIVFAASTAGVKPMLWLRPKDEMAAKELAGTENAGQPFWSPDSRWVGFFADGKLKKVPAAGGPAQVIAEGVADPRGGAWGPGDTILFAASGGGVHRVSTLGGMVTLATKLDTSRQESAHQFPYFLPDGNHFLFLLRSSVLEQRGIYVRSLDGKTKKFLVHTNWGAVYGPPGYLLYLDDDVLTARVFDAGRLEVSGQPLAVAERVAGSSGGHPVVSVSDNGTLAYAGAFVQIGRLAWFDRGGKTLDSVGPEGDYLDFRLSPDDQRLAATLLDRKVGSPDIWLTDLARGSTSRFTLDPLIDASAIWSPDGARIVFRTNRRGQLEFFQKSAGGSGNEEGLLPLETHASNSNLCPTDWSPDGRYIIYSDPSMTTGWDLWLLPLAGERKPQVFLNSPSDEMHANFSPDGRFVAYSSNESGRFEVHVQTFPLSDRKWQISTNGGYEPRWRRDGRELYYLSEGRKLMAVPVSTTPAFEPGVPKALFQTRVPMGAHPLRTNYVPARDGQRFLINTQSGEAPPTPITVVLNWTAGLKK